MGLFVFNSELFIVEHKLSNIIVVGILYAFCCNIAALDIPLTFDMPHLCGDQIELGFASNPRGRLTFSGSNYTGTESGSCSVVIKPGLTKDHIGFKFEGMQLSPGVCLAVHERYNEHDDTNPVKGTPSWLCDDSSNLMTTEYRTDKDKELVVTVTWSGKTEANISLLFALYSIKEVAVECINYTCNDGVCSDNSFNCSYGHTPCDLHDCKSHGIRAHKNRGLTVIQIFGIALAVLAGLGLCMCKVVVRSSYVKEDMINRLASYVKPDGNGSKLPDDAECNGMKRLVSITEKPEHQEMCLQQETSDNERRPSNECISQTEYSSPNNGRQQRNKSGYISVSQSSESESNNQTERDQGECLLQKNNHIPNGNYVVIHERNTPDSTSNNTPMPSLRDINAISNIEYNKVPNAYGSHRHLAPYSTQPTTCSESSGNRLVCLKQDETDIEYRQILSKSYNCVQHRNGDSKLSPASLTNLFNEKFKSCSLPDMLYSTADIMLNLTAEERYRKDSHLKTVARNENSDDTRCSRQSLENESSCTKIQ